MKGKVSGRVRLSELVVRPKLAFLPKASFAFASATSFLVTTPITFSSTARQVTLADNHNNAGLHHNIGSSYSLMVL